MDKAQIKKWSIIASLATALLLAVTAYFKYDHKAEPHVAGTHSFSGFVVNASGQPISHARVRVFQDSTAAEPVYSDSDGSFAVQVSDEAKSIVITVVAAGYESYDGTEPVKRSTPAQIRLVKGTDSSPNLPLSSQPHAPSKPKQAPGVKRVESAKPDDSETKQPNSSLNTGILNNAPNQGRQSLCADGVVNCNLAPNEGHQDTYYGAPRPAPAARFRQQSASEPTIEHYGLCKNQPCIEVVISAVDYFAEPIFVIKANARFMVIGTVQGKRQGQAVMLQNVQHTYYRPDRTDESVLAIVLDGGPLSSSSWIIVTVQPSGKVEDFKITDVESVTR